MHRALVLTLLSLLALGCAGDDGSPTSSSLVPIALTGLSFGDDDRLELTLSNGSTLTVSAANWTCAGDADADCVAAHRANPPCNDPATCQGLATDSLEVNDASFTLSHEDASGRLLVTGLLANGAITGAWSFVSTPCACSGNGSFEIR